ncbi:MAG TPA: FAD/NAD(P)-binding oxidoreductase [Syntrophomonadaceae bacterium]|nr:FAD/NAD(P)-binding oxidoreductase [Syntrophomonadaceae bacterium]
MKYVIIGNSAAAVGAVEGIRSRDQDGKIIIVASENHHTYSRPLISYLIAGKIDEHQMYYRPADFYQRNQVEVYLGEKAVRFLPEQKKVRLAPSDIEIDYDRILIAAGGAPIVPRCFKGNYDNLFNFHSWDDVAALSERLNTGSVNHIAIAGGGLIGLKAAESLILRGQKVTVIQAAGYLLNSILDPETAEIVKNYLETQGVSIILNNPVARIEGENAVDSLILQDGSRVNCDIAVLTAGVSPNLKWLGDIDLEYDEGILVNPKMETSLTGVYAAGDIAQIYDEKTQKHHLLPVLPEAYRQGRTAGMNMAGDSCIYQGLVSNSIPLLGLNISTMGNNSEVGPGVEVIKKRTGIYNYRRITLQNNRIKGFIMIGEFNRCGILRGLIEQQIDVSSFRTRLLEDDFGLLDVDKYIKYNQRKEEVSCQE